MGIAYNPRTVTDGLVLALDAGNVKSSYKNFIKAKVYSVYGGGLRSANYSVQYSDDNSNWTTAFSGVCSNNISCGIQENTGLGNGSYGYRRYWRYVEGSAVVSHHPRVSRIILTDVNGVDYNLIVYTSDNCSDTGTYIVGTVSVDFATNIWTDLSGQGNNGTLTNGPTYSNSNGGSIVFDGVNDYMQANVNTTTLDGDPSLTVDMFVRRRTGTNIGRSTGFWGIGGSGQGNSIEGWTPTANLIHLDVYDSTRLATSYYYPEGEFIHICWTKNGPGTETTNVKCYINGVEVSLTKTRNATRTNQFNTSTSGIGICLGRINADSSSFHAPIDIGSFKVYDRALTSNEVQQNFNATRSRFGI